MTSDEPISLESAISAQELFEQTCNAWGVTVDAITDRTSFRTVKTVTYRDRILDVTWDPEVALDNSALYGELAEKCQVLRLLNKIASEILNLPVQAPVMNADDVNIVLNMLESLTKELEQQMEYVRKRCTHIDKRGESTILEDKTCSMCFQEIE